MNMLLLQPSIISVAEEITSKQMETNEVFSSSTQYGKFQSFIIEPQG